MTLHNITTQAHGVNRDLAAAAERDAVVAFLRREAAFIDDRSDRSDAADALLTAADRIENGDHRR